MDAAQARKLRYHTVYIVVKIYLIFVIMIVDDVYVILLVVSILYYTILYCKVIAIVFIKM